MAESTSSMDKVLAALAELEPKAAGSRLAEASKSIPTEEGTEVVDLSTSPELAEFRRQLATGMIEAKVVDQVFSLIGALLLRAGLIAAL